MLLKYYVPWDLNLLIVLLWAWAVEISGEEYQKKKKKKKNMILRAKPGSEPKSKFEIFDLKTKKLQLGNHPLKRLGQADLVSSEHVHENIST